MPLLRNIAEKQRIDDGLQELGSMYDYLAKVIALVLFFSHFLFLFFTPHNASPVSFEYLLTMSVEVDRPTGSSWDWEVRSTPRHRTKSRLILPDHAYSTG